MFERLVEWCGRNRGLVLGLALLVGVAGAISLRNSPLDAIPDLTDPQVIIFTEWMGRNPQLLEDQVTYPLVTAFISAPRVRTVRGFSMFGMSFVYVIFEDGVDQYWARTRVVEYLSNVSGQLPQGVTPKLGPDATASGWVFMYTLQDRTGQQSLQELRSLQDFTVRYALAQVRGVAEVASLGGFQKQYQVVVDPERLQALGVSVPDIVDAVRMSNQDVGASVVEWVGREYVFRGLGYVKEKADIEKVVVKVTPDGVPLRVRDVARVDLGPAVRRGLADWNGEGETVAGVVVMRSGENALRVIERVKARLEELKPSLPPGVEIRIAYDRSDLILRSISTLTNALLQQMAVVLVFIAIFLMHLRSALVAVAILPLATLSSFIFSHASGNTANIMSLGGIIIAIGDMVDATVVLIENAHRKLEGNPDPARREAIVIESAKELARPIFSSLMVIAVSFLPVFALEAQEGRMFHPLAYTKTYAMACAAVLSITLGPALMVWFIRGRIRPETANPVNRLAIALYRPVLRFALRWRRAVLLGAAVALASMAFPFSRIGSEFMPPLDEGSYLFMPVTFPNISIEEARQILQLQDQLIKRFPEVESVLGKAGRADTPTDPAPLSMFETVVVLKPRSAWRPGMTQQRLEQELSQALELPGLQNALTMPIKARIDMLTTGIRTPVGIKIFGDDLAVNEEIGQLLEHHLRSVAGTRSVYADRETQGVYADFTPDRDALARYGLRVMDVLDVVESAIGGMVVGQTVEGRERYTINVRYPREYRTDRDMLERVLVPARLPGSTSETMGAANMSGGGSAGTMQIPLYQLGKIAIRSGPPMIKDENGKLVSYVYVDTSDSDLGGYVERAKAALKDVKLPVGYRLEWTGQYEFLQRMQARMRYLVPLTLLLIFGLLYLEFYQVSLAIITMFSVPFALVGSFWFLYLQGFNLSVAVWVGLIALVGVAAETASIMLVYLEESFQRWRKEGKLQSAGDLSDCVLEGAVLRVRPLLMTVGMNLVGLAPIMLSSGAGADVTQRIASPMVGGLVSLTILTLVLIPCIYIIYRRRSVRELQ